MTKTFNKPACIFIALLKFYYCLENVSQVSYVAHGSLVEDLACSISLNNPQLIFEWPIGVLEHN